MEKANTGAVDFPALEREVLEFWEKSGIFRKSVGLYEREMVFYDGPPFPTGAPHYGTIFVSIIKDALARFFTMDGWSVPRRWGWDCHGLPIENAVERKLKIAEKGEIESKYGVAEFNRQCRALVSECNAAWEEYIRKIGRWVDYAGAYRTLDTGYMESVLWVFKACYDKGLIYKDYRVTPYCCHCETALSISDTRESDSTRLRRDPELIVRFKAEATMDGKNVFFLAWTTTPWTLISNLALAVNRAFDYVAAEQPDGSLYVLAEAALEKTAALTGLQPKVVRRFKGSELVGMRYRPLFRYFAEPAPRNCFQVLHGDFVALEEGVGIVHCAPAFGEEDYWLCKRQGLEMRNPVDSRGRFTAEVPDLAGVGVFDANREIIRRLKAQGDLLYSGLYEHNYPHCWRCREPLIYRAMDAWYFAVEKIKQRLLERNQDINWAPEHVKNGRFGKWLEGARDWNISRSRYWGTPIPVWECERPGCGERRALGSIAEIETVSGRKVTDLHKEHLDPVTFACEKCGAAMRRVPEVLDCWFESGAMPFGQCHYPFENREWFEAHFPADFIVEYPGQIRGWFYYLHVLAVALFDRIAFKNCLVHGTLLAEDGSKFSKSKKNFTDPMVLINTYGADALRLYLLSSPAVVMEDLNFKDAGVKEQIKKILLPVWNAFSFFRTYAEIDGYRGDAKKTPSPLHQLDRWILGRLLAVSRRAADGYRTFYLNEAMSPLYEFVEDLTNWYIRRSRERFWAEGMGADKQSAYDTLFYVLVNLVLMLAPAAPFISDRLYRDLTGEESVHLSRWPQVPAEFEAPELTEEVRLTRLVASLGLALRQKAGVKVRQPLPALYLALPAEASKKMTASQIETLKSELNVKQVCVLDDPASVAELQVTPNLKRLGPRLGRDTQRLIASLKAGRFKVEGGNVVVQDGEWKWTLGAEDVTIAYRGRAASEAVSEQGVVVALDVRVTPELREEGIANDINRAVQNLRKQAGYSVSDRILLHIEGELAAEHLQRLAALALAELARIPPDKADASETLDIDGRRFVIRVAGRHA